MTSSILVTRLQNRRGTQANFNALYPTYPGTGTEVLQPGEIALCTDSSRIFIGGENGTYIEILSTTRTSEVSYTPLVILLAPTSTPTHITQLDFLSAPFRNIIYSVSDSGVLDPTHVSTNYSRTGTLELASTATSTYLVDENTELNTNTTSYSLTFTATVSGSGVVQISYQHNFPTSLSFSTVNMFWKSL